MNETPQKPLISYVADDIQRLKRKRQKDRIIMRTVEAIFILLAFAAFFAIGCFLR